MNDNYSIYCENNTSSVHHRNRLNTFTTPFGECFTPNSFKEEQNANGDCQIPASPSITEETSQQWKLLLRSAPEQAFGNEFIIPKQALHRPVPSHGLKVEPHKLDSDSSQLELNIDSTPPNSRTNHCAIHNVAGKNSAYTHSTTDSTASLSMMNFVEEPESTKLELGNTTRKGYQLISINTNSNEESTSEEVSPENELKGTKGRSYSTQSCLDKDNALEIYSVGGFKRSRSFNNSHKKKRCDLLPGISTTQIIKAIIPQLAKMDRQLSVQQNGRKGALSLTELKAGYEKLLHNFHHVGTLENSVFIYSLALCKLVRKNIIGKYSFDEGEFLLVYAGALFLSIKMANDIEVWLLEDFSSTTGLDKEIIEEMELFVLQEALDFRVLVPLSQLQREAKSVLTSITE